MWAIADISPLALYPVPYMLKAPLAKLVLITFLSHVGHQDGMYEAARDIAETKPVHFKPYSYVTVLHPDPSSLSQKRSVNVISPLGYWVKL